MADDIEFIKRGVASLRTEQVIEQNPLRKLSIEKDIEDTLKVIDAIKSTKSDKRIPNNSSAALEVNSVYKSTTNPPNKKPPTSGTEVKPSNLLNRPIGYVWLTALGAVLAAMILFVVHKYLGINL